MNIYGFNHEYPYSNFHELNLDWIIKEMIGLNESMKNFIKINTIKYANPIQWNITSQYEKNTVVVDPATGNAYISNIPVPSGVNINNTEYWSIIGNFSQLYDSIKEAITNNDEGSSTTASENRDLGDLVWLENDLYRVTAVMTAGTAYVPGTNCEHITIAELITNIYYEDDELLELHGVTKSGLIITTADYHTYSVGREAIEIKKV